MIPRHFRGIKIKIFRGEQPPDPPRWLTLTRLPLTPPVAQPRISAHPVGKKS